MKCIACKTESKRMLGDWESTECSRGQGTLERCEEGQESIERVALQIFRRAARARKERFIGRASEGLKSVI